MPLYIYGGLTTIKPAWANGGNQLPVTSLTTDVTSSLIWWYRLQSGDITSTSLYNAVTKTSDATVFGSPTFSTTIYKTGNSSLTLSNSSNRTQYIQFPSFNFTGSAYTITWWCRLASVGLWPNSMIFSSTNTNAYNNGLSYWTQTNNVTTSYPNIEIRPYGTASGLNILDTNWHFYVMIIYPNSGASPKGKLNIDNGTVSNNIGSDATYGTNLNCLYNYYGFSDWDVNQRTDGNICDIRLYNGALSSQQIAALYNIGSSTAILTSYSVSASGSNITITWTGTGINNIILTNNTTSTSYGPITTSGTTYSLTYNVTNNFYITPFDSSSRAGLATKLFTIPV
jgi:hypothetical protein